MAVNDAGDILGILDASRAVLAGVAGINSAYVLSPNQPPTDASLPAAIQTVFDQALSESEITYTAAQEQINHEWFLDLLIKRSGDIQEDARDALPFIPLVLAAYREHLTLGTNVVRDCHPASYQIVGLTHGTNTYLAVRFRMSAKAKTAVALT
jgi:hypothetical protein